MCSSDSTKDYKYFVDEKFNGIDKLNDSCSNNISTVSKLIRIFKDYAIAQDIYSKSFSKSNANLALLAKTKNDCFFPIMELLSTSFTVYTNVQKEFMDSMNRIIKNLTLAFESNEETISRVVNSRDSSIVTNFKNSQIQMIKARAKYSSVTSSNGDVYNNDDKSIKRLKENYETSIEKYNKSRIQFLDVMRTGFDRSKQIQFNHLDSMQKAIKSIGNALAKLLSNLKESVDLIKKFYKESSTDAMFQLWVDSNKTVDDIAVDCFPKAVMEVSDCIPSTEGLLIDIQYSPPNPSDGKQKKAVPPRKNVENVIDNGCSIIDQDIPDAVNNDPIGINKKIFERNANTSKPTKGKFTPLTFFKRFQSTNDLTSTTESKDSADDEDSWQCKSNLNSHVTVDDEGFIVRDTDTDKHDKSSGSSSSDESSDHRIKGIKVNIRPVTNSIIKTASKSEVVNAALQLPIPKREKLKVSEIRRVSHLQRSPKSITNNDKDRYSRRSQSVSEMALTENYVDSTDKAMQGNAVIPIASAITEILSSSDGGVHSMIHGQLVLAWPLYIRERFQSSLSSTMPDSIAFELVSDSNTFSSVQILRQYKEITKLESITANKYNVVILKELLQKIISDDTLISKGNRISIPLLEYSMEVNNNAENIIECDEQWTLMGAGYVQFFFTISSKYIEDNKDITVHIKLLSEGQLEQLSSTKDKSPEIHNQKYWSIRFGKGDRSVSVKIKSDNHGTVRLKLGYEFQFENCSVASPLLHLLSSDNEMKSHFKISLMHYRAISTGNFSQLFDFNMS